MIENRKRWRTIDSQWSYFEAAWKPKSWDTHYRIIQRAGRFTRPQGELTLTMSANQAVRRDLLHFLDVLQKAV